MADETIEIKIEGDTTNINVALTKTNRKLTDTEKKAATASKRMKELKVVGVAAIAGIGAAAIKSVKEFAQFDDQLRGVKTLLDANSFGAKGLEQGFKDMTAQVKDLGKRVPVDIGAMNKALFDTISAGVDAGKAVGVLETSAKLAVAGLTDVSTATDGLTSALNAYALDAEDADEVASKFFVAQKKGKTTIAELSNGFGLAGASASAFGVTLDELLAAISAVTTAGVKTSSAYTGLNAVLAGIAKPTADAQAEAKRLGIEFNSTALRAKGLKGFLDQLTQSSNFNKRSIERLFGSVEAQKIAFALTGEQANTFADTLGELSEKQKALNTLAKAYGVQADGIKSKMDILSNKAQLLAIDFGETLAPALLWLVSGLDSLGVAFNRVTSATEKVTFGTINKELRETQQIINELKKGADDIDIYGMPTVAALGRLKKIEELERKLLVLQTRKQGMIAEANGNEATAERLSKEKELEEQANADKVAGKQATADKIAADAQAKFEEEIARVQENGEVLTAEEMIVLNDKLAALQEAKDIAAVRELEQQGKHDKAMEKLQKIKAKKDKAATKAQLTVQKAYTDASLSLATNLSNLSIAISGKQNKALFLLQKAAAIAQAIVSTQLAATQALAVPPAPNYLLSGITKAAGYANVATIAATAIKGFQDGGIVGGNSFTGDRVPAMVNSGEMILNTAQQASLFEQANAGGGGGTEIVLSLKDGLVDFIEAEVIERRALGEATI